VYGTSHVVTGGGNAMALAVADMSQSSHRLSLTEGLLCDEWCEWERTVLRPALANPKKLAAALQHLEGALQGVHLAGTRETLADIVVVSTLVVLADKLPADWVTAYPGIHRMVNSHHTAIETAQEVISTMVAQTVKAMPKIDLNEASIYQLLTNIFRQAVEILVQDLTGDDLEALGVKWSANAVSKCGNAKHGDYQCSAAMFTFAAIKKSGLLPAGMVKPQDFAQRIMESLGPDHPVLTDLGLNGPGFVVCRVRDTFLQDRMNQFLQEGKLPVPKVSTQICVVDFSSPNIAKEMHVGHLRSTIIGETVCRVLEYVGHKVHRVNHVGDWGTQFGMLIQYLREEYPDAVGKDDGALPNITDLTLFYKSAKLRFDESPEFKKASQLNVVQLQAGDPECRKIWQMLCDVSRREFEKVYKRLDVTLTEFGESFYNSQIPPVIEELVEKGIVQQEEGGAKIAWLDDFPSPLMLQKTDGGFGYDSTDVSFSRLSLT
jgi:arginyl-tRNA synthetase